MDRTTLQQLAALAKLDLTEAETSQALADLSRILGYCESLADAPTEGVEPSPYPLPLQDRLRPDEPGASLDPEAVLANGPDVVEGCYRVPRVVEG